MIPLCTRPTRRHMERGYFIMQISQESVLCKSRAPQHQVKGHVVSARVKWVEVI